MRIVSNIGILHDNAVFQHSALTDLNAAEDHTVFDLSIDDAAICDQRIANLGREAVFDRHLIAYLGEYRFICREQS